MWRWRSTWARRSATRCTPPTRATASGCPTSCATQVERIKQVVEALNIPIFTAEGFEADDVLATLARQAEAQGVDTLIVTGDRDILQVVDDHIRVLTSGRKFSDTIIYDPAAVQEKYGLRPDQLVDSRRCSATSRTTSPASSGIGEKGATDLLQKYGTLDAVYAHLDEMKPDRAKKALEEGQADAELSRKLGRIITDVPMQLDLAACRTRDYDRAQAVALFQELAFRSLVERLPATEEGDEETRRQGDRGAEEAGSRGAEGPRSSWRCSQAMTGELPSSPNLPIYQSTDSAVTAHHHRAALAEVAEQLAAAPMIAFDTETTGTDPQAAELVGLALAWEPATEPGFSRRRLSRQAYIPLRHPDIAICPGRRCAPRLQPVFADPKIAKVAHNASYDLGMLARYGLTVAGDLVDTMVAEWLIDPGSHGLG